MEQYEKTMQIRWADLDLNGHLRHSVYYDWGSYLRITFLTEHGLSPIHMQDLQLGPILFREECVFKKEVRLENNITINLLLLHSKKDFSRWSIQHIIMKEKEVAAILTVEGAWMDITNRKLCTPPQDIIRIYAVMPVAENFIWTQ